MYKEPTNSCKNQLKRSTDPSLAYVDVEDPCQVTGGEVMAGY
ncbi:hypothetical protein VCRA2116O29_310010 [Vibrio crassostreae]|nr:hypothetical protein VCRA2119O48_290009 [Vibrio crassostreae]CAK2466709.1 hypothetical protein VCRA2116O29_310010 [Vibrio crassostreae]CAK3758674.1 hypothetical protein VCRA2123O74_290062 [Vibrio crassostreae]CAK3948429.1 hypothetical protein VCRA212O16_430009 [Vibrio crassostreae]